jgi:hypothetical protein
MSIIRNSFLSLSLFLFTSSIFAASTPVPPNIVGTYKCKYHDPSSTPPDSSETITFEQNGDTIRVKQIATDSVIPYAVGIGLYNKTVNNAFSYIYWLQRSPNVTNVQFFMIKPDGSLEGTFAQSNKSKSGTEVCTKGV